MPSHHPPLGPLKPHETTRAAPAPPENTARWRTNLARGDQARAYEAADNEYLSRLIALQVQSNLEDHKKANPDFPVYDPLFKHLTLLNSVKTKDGRQRGTLLITDRAMDVLAPFIHEFTYQAMANDLLPIEDGSRYASVMNGIANGCRC
jgi:syntaxin-binding protein 1